MSKEYQAKQAALVAEHIKKQDIVITTALIPGRPAPRLISADMVKSMKPGSVIVDLAVERGGNVEGAKAGEVADVNGVKIVGHLNVAGRLAASASGLYAKNLYAFLEILVDKKAKALAVNWDDEIVKATALTQRRRRRASGLPAEIRRLSRQLEGIAHGHRQSAGSRRRARRPPPKSRARPPKPRSNMPMPAAALVAASVHAATGAAIDPFVFRFSIFVLAVFVGYYVVWSVTPALHTPLMSVTNAISSVIVVGALLAVSVELARNDSGPIWARMLGFFALILASVNIFGGFLVTQRMLAMYKKKG